MSEPRHCARRYWHKLRSKGTHAQPRDNPDPGRSPVRDGAGHHRHERLDLRGGRRPRHDGAAGPARDHRLRAGDGGVHADRREARRHVRAAQDLRDRPGHLRDRLVHHRDQPERRGPAVRLVADRGAGRLPGDSVDRRADRRELLGQGARHGLRPPRRDRRRRRRGGSAHRRVRDDRLDLAHRVRRRDRGRGRDPHLRHSPDPDPAHPSSGRSSTSSGRAFRRSGWGSWCSAS